MKKVCLLTGASGTLGSTFCRLYADTYNIAAVYRQNAPLLPSQSQQFLDPLALDEPVPGNTHPIFSIKADLTKDGALERVVDLVLARFDRIDLLINAAVHSVWAPIVDSNYLLASLEQQFRVNTMVPLQLATMIAQRFWRYQDKENLVWNRSIVNVSSIAGLNVYDGYGQSVYSASKAALNFLTRHMANEFWDFKIRVNATAPDSFPSIVATESVAQSIIQLAEGRMTGEILLLDRNVV